MNKKLTPPRPPQWVASLFIRITAPHLREEIQGDLDELFRKRVQRYGYSKARWLYILDVFLLLHPRLWRREVNARVNPNYTRFSEYSSPFFLSPDMFRNYLKIAWRNLLRNKVYSAINVGGLAVGMAVAMLIGLWLWDELSFNKYHQNYDRIAQVAQHGTVNGETWTASNLPYPLATELKTNYPADFKRVLKAWQIQDHIVAVGNDKLSLTGEFIESEAPDMLTLHMLKGTRAGLREPGSVLLSSSAAKALFGDADPMNKVVKINNAMGAKVTGVYEDLPHNTEFYNVKFFAPWDLYVSANPYIEEQGWVNNFMHVYAELQPYVDVNTVSTKIKDIHLKNLAGNTGQIAFNFQLFLHPMSKWHLHSGFDKQGNNTGGLVQYVWLFSLIGAFVLLLACINFMNLSTARSEKRAKEVGIRKAIGSMRGQLISQFFSESFLVVGLAFVLAIGLVTVSINWFSEVADKEMVILWTNLYFWLFSVGFILLTGLLSGSYPALYLSRFQPIKVLKGTFQVGRFAGIPRKVLVVAQFAVSITLIIGTILVYRQIQYAKNRPVGYTREGLIDVHMSASDFYTKFEVLRQELLNTGVVYETAQSASRATELWSNNIGFDWTGKDPSLQADFGTLTVSPEYGKTVGWQFIAGRDFSRGFSSDSAAYVVNEAAVRFMALKSPVGQIIRRDGKPFQIIGVIRDMVMGSPFESVYPTIFFLQGPINWINIKIKPSVSAANALLKIEAVFKKVVPSTGFDYHFVDQEYGTKFADEERIRSLVSFFAILAIFISCLGLFGLASFVAEQRTKEIGVRKVLGASVLNLWGLLSKDFVLLVVIAFGIATPIAYYFLSNWLQQYEYRTDMSWWIFAASGAGALVITLLTVSFQSVKAALMNPVKSLRSE